ncbi:FIGNL1-interacting regulator of recombination and mitosis [Cynoglossus semilaevis]|uniref:FIGNL1-interacting regulator of recombination and mitosis n=1 Tax=Cynoglossus semilaevis TaxID=244447 RepID=UPI00049866AA|nr:uncharacterized protein C1orf112 homolog [Cynoglossus semilaevis]
MSQTNTSLLDEVVQWSQETCRQELKSVLPKLNSLQQKSVSWEEHIRILKIITDMFLPHIRLSELEEQCFAIFLPKAVVVFDSMIEEILDQVGGLSSQNVELRGSIRSILQAMVQVINAVSACVQRVRSFEQIPDLDAIRSLPTCVLKVLRKTFLHCKESEVVYCNRLSLVADLLQGLFKEAYALQKSLLELLDQISLDSGASEEDISGIVTIIHSLLDICSIISDLDIALHANTWKFLIKQSLRHRLLVEERLHHGDISSSLCENLLSFFRSSVELAKQIVQAGLKDATQSTEYKLFQKTAKTSRFFANTLVHYIKEFKYFLTESHSSIHHLYLQILSKFPPSLSAQTLPTALSEELRAAALIPMDALLLQLMPLRPFAEIVLQPDLQLSPEHELPQCLLLVNVVGQLVTQTEDVLRLWHTGSQFSEDTPRLPLYKALFMSFRRCYTERVVPVLLPGVMMKGQAQVQVSVHHHVCVNMCASVASLPPVYFPVLERCLVDAVLQADLQTALLATDVWCFTARYGTAELCLHHVLLVAQLVKTCTVNCYQFFYLGLLLKRMVFLITPNHQMELLIRFPPSEEDNLPVWRHILLKALSQEVRQCVETEIIGIAQRLTLNWQTKGHKLGHVAKLNVVLFSLLAVVRGQSSHEEQCVLSVMRIVTQLWSRMNPDQVLTHPVLQSTVQLLLSLSAVLVKNIDPHVISQALLCVEVLVSKNCPDHLLLAVLEFLASLGKVFVPHQSQSQILPKLSSLFGVLLAEGPWLLHQHALETFSHYAEVTNHEEVISQSLSKEETKTEVVNYLSKTVNAQEEPESRLHRLKLERAVVQQHNKKLENDKEEFVCIKEAEESRSDSEPCPKRARQEPSAEEYSRYVQTAENSLKALQALIESQTDPCPKPPWLEGKLQELQTLIVHIRTLGQTG